LFSKLLTKFGLEYSLVDCTDLKAIEKAIIPGKTKVRVTNYLTVS